MQNYHFLLSCGTSKDFLIDFHLNLTKNSINCKPTITLEKKKNVNYPLS